MKQAFKPDWATHPADHIREYLEHKRWRQCDLARAAGLTQKNVSDIMTGGRVTPRAAIGLEKALGLGAEVWLNLQSNWDLHQERNNT